MSLAKFERKRVEDLLAGHGLVSAEVLAKSVAEAHEKGVGLLSLLAQENRISESDAAQLLSKEYQLPFIKTSSYELQREALGELPPEIVSRDGLVPLDRIGRTLVCAVADPPTPERATALARLLAVPVQCYITTISEAAKTLSEHFRDLLQAAELKHDPTPAPPIPTPKATDVSRGLSRASAGSKPPAEASTDVSRGLSRASAGSKPPAEASTEAAREAKSEMSRPAPATAKPHAGEFEADKQSLVIKAKVGSRATMLEARDETRPRLQPAARSGVSDDEPPLFVKSALARQRAQAAAAAPTAPAPAPEPTPKPAAPPPPSAPVSAPAPVAREAAPGPKPPESFEFEFE